MKRFIHFGGTLRGDLAQVRDVMKRLDRGEHVEPEWHLTFARPRRQRPGELVARIRQRLRAQANEAELEKAFAWTLVRYKKTYEELATAPTTAKWEDGLIERARLRTDGRPQTDSAEIVRQERTDREPAGK